MNQAPSADPRPSSDAIRSPSRVFPTPPGPTRLTRRAVASFFLISPSSRRRPTKLVVSAGRLPDRCLGLALTTHRLIYPDDSRGGLRPQADKYDRGATEPAS